MMRSLLLSLLLALGFSLGASADAVTLNVVGGVLTGASDVNVGGTLYDVQFVDGTCIDVFDGCDAAGDFAFGDLTTANLASQALLDQVFVDGVDGNFDTVMTIVTGCSSAVTCTVQTPYAVVDAADFNVSIALNFPDEVNDGLGAGPNARTADSGFGVVGSFYVYGVWSLPEPSTGAILALGMVGFVATQRRRMG